MGRRTRILLIAFFVVLTALWCTGTAANAQQQGRPRSSDGNRERKAQPRERAHEAPPSNRAVPRAQSERDRRGAQDRHPRPGQYDRRDDRNRYDQYHWRNYQRPDRGRWYRFPRSYRGADWYGRTRFYGRNFGPHYRLWHYDRSSWVSFYWPYWYRPNVGCGWYWVPTNRRPADRYDYDDGDWEYSNYRLMYLCFD